MSNEEQDHSFGSMDVVEEDLTNGTPNHGEIRPMTYSLEKIKVKDVDIYPIELDIMAEIQNILAAGMFKNIESPVLYEKLCDMMMSERYMGLVEGLFWTIFVVKFQGQDTELYENYKRKLGGLYSEYFSLLVQPKEELSNLGIFGASYICHIMFFNLFPRERDLFDMRFILDCYHIVIHEINGIFVSDFYIQNSIERIFGNRFFHYEKRAEKKKKITKKDFRNEPLLRDLSYDLKDLPQVPGGLELAHQLSTKLRKSPKKFKTANLAELTESITQRSTNTVNFGSVPHEKVMKLTQPNEDKSFSGSEKGPYFPKIKFNCHQISPTVSSFLENSNSTLPFQKRKLIQYSNNKHIAETGPIISYQTTIESARESKTEKKDKKKNQVRGTVSDYKLQNRAEDYYLGYMSKDVKNKFRFALDMKYILDNVKPTLRGSNSLKSLNEDPSKKFIQPFLNTQRPIMTDHNNVIREETDDEVRELEHGNHKKEIEKIDTMLDLGDVSRRFVREETLMPLDLTKREKMLGDSMVDSVIKTKMSRQSFGPESPKISMRKSQLVLPKIHVEGAGEKEKEKLHLTSEDLKRSYMAERLKYTHAANKKLGKGRFFVSLTDHKDEPEDSGKRNGKEKYADKRRLYVNEHDKLIKKDTDSNIEGIVRALMFKQNRFQKEFSKINAGAAGKKTLIIEVIGNFLGS